MGDSKTVAELEAFFSEHGYWILITFKSVFLWPYSDYRINLIGRLWFYISMIVLILATIACIYEEIENPLGTDRFNLAEMLLQLSIEIVTTIQHAMGIIHKQNLCDCIRTILDLNKIGQDSVENDLWLKSLKSAYHYSCIIFCLIFASFSSFIYIPFIWNYAVYNTYEPILHVKYFYDDDTYFGYIFIFETLVINFYTIFIGTLVCSYIFYSYMLITGFQQTKKKIEDLKFNHQSSYNLELQSDEIEKKLIEIIKTHNECIKLYDVVGKFSRPILLSVLLHLLIAYTILGFMMLSQFKKGLPMEAAIMAFGFISCVFILATACVPSQSLIDASNAVGISCYCSEWYQLKPKHRLMFLMTMKRTLKPCGWVAGPSIVLNFQTVTIVLKTGMSYITTMLSLEA